MNDTKAVALKHTPGPWRIRDNMMREDGTAPRKVGQEICQKCHAPTGNDHPAEINIATKNWGVCSLQSYDPEREHDQMMVDAQLIAAAPKLLDGCNALYGLLTLLASRDDIGDIIKNVMADNHRVAEARDAIAAAGGNP